MRGVGARSLGPGHVAREASFPRHAGWRGVWKPGPSDPVTPVNSSTRRAPCLNAPGSRPGHATSLRRPHSRQCRQLLPLTIRLPKNPLPPASFRNVAPRDDSRTELPTVTALLVLFANLLMAREPVYGVGEWAALFPPDLLGLREQDLTRLHDDRLGRSLDRMFEGVGPTLIMAVVRQIIQEFAISLDELHNDSTPCRSTVPTTRPARKANNGDDRRTPSPGDTARRGVPTSSNCSTS